MDTRMQKTGTVLALAGALALLPAQVDAQVGQPQQPEQQEQAQCVATLQPQQDVRVGEGALELTVQLSEDVGAITGVEGGQSGITTTRPEDMPRTEMAAEEQPQPITLGEGQNQWKVYVNTQEAQPGQQRLVLVGERGMCNLDLEVSP